MSLGIRAKLYVGFGLMMGLMTAVAGVGWASPNPNLMFGALAAALLVALIAGIAITRALERPLRDSAAFLRELAEGDLSLRMSGAGGPEMDELAGSCNAFLDQLQAMHALREAWAASGWQDWTPPTQPQPAAPANTGTGQPAQPRSGTGQPAQPRSGGRGTGGWNGGGGNGGWNGGWGGARA